MDCTNGYPLTADKCNIFKCNLFTARQLMMSDCEMLIKLSEFCTFEICTGVNGRYYYILYIRVWVSTEDNRHLIMFGLCLTALQGIPQAISDENGKQKGEQKEIKKIIEQIAKKVLKK